MNCRVYGKSATPRTILPWSVTPWTKDLKSMIAYGSATTKTTTAATAASANVRTASLNSWDEGNLQRMPSKPLSTANKRSPYAATTGASTGAELTLVASANPVKMPAQMANLG